MRGRWREGEIRGVVESLRSRVMCTLYIRDKPNPGRAVRVERQHDGSIGRCGDRAEREGEIGRRERGR